MQLEFAPFSDGNPRAGLPTSRLVNMYPEVTRAGPSKSARLQRPCLAVDRVLGVSSVLGIFQRDGVFNGDVFAVVDTTLYRGEEEIGDVIIGPVAKFAASRTQLIVCIGGSAYCYDGETLEQVTVPDDKQVSWVEWVGSRFYYLVADDDRWYFSAIDDGSTIDGLAFATADSAPDPTIGAAVLKDQMIFFGRTSIEFWSQTGDQDAPLIRSLGTSYSKGCVSAQSIVSTDNRVFWIGSDLRAYTLGAPDRISTDSFDALLRECSRPEEITGFAAAWGGHEWVVWNLPDLGTWAYHIPSGEWGEWTSHGRTTFRCRNSVLAGATCYLGAYDSGTIYRLTDEFTDGDDPVENIATCVAPPGPMRVLELECAVGVGPADNYEPIVEMRYSDDLGRTWTAWRQRTFGKIGKYRHRVRWTNLGTAKRQRHFQFRNSDPVRATFCAVYLNER